MTASTVVLAGLIVAVFGGLAGLIIVNPSNLGHRGKADRRTTLATVTATLVLTVPTVVAVLATSTPAHAATAYMGVPTTSPDGGTRVPCATEDVGLTRCVWDGRHMGDGVGRSFVLPTGSADDRIVYVSHARAHYLLTGK